MIKFTKIQNDIIHQPFTRRIFIQGIAGSGKTTSAVARMLGMLEKGIPGESILVLTPTRVLASPYLEASQSRSDISGGPITCLTMGGLAQRMDRLFWPQISEIAGFANPKFPPTFLTMETTQYFMARLVRPLLDQGFFSSVTMDRNRLYSQVVDNLNKAAVVGFSYLDIGERLKAAWNGDPGQLRVYDDVQHCVTVFRKYCLEHNLLDFSLQVELFLQHVWSLELCQNYLITTFRHLFVDNLEEDASVTHDLLGEWLNECASACVIYDDDAGFRRFLGASPETSVAIREKCDQTFNFTTSLVMSKPVAGLSQFLENSLSKIKDIHLKRSKDIPQALIFEPKRFFPDMLDWVCQQVKSLVQENGTSPNEIAILTPFLSDSLRFSIINRLEEAGIRARSHRPSRALRDEPIAQCMLKLAILAHSQWSGLLPDIRPNRFDFAYALMQSIDGLDLIRAQLLASEVFRTDQGMPFLESFTKVKPVIQDRITYQIGEKYEVLRQWLEDYTKDPPLELDHFLSRLFGEVLSQPGFGFHTNLAAGEITANLIESIQKFRWITANGSEDLFNPLGLEYVQMVQEGVIAAQYVRSWETWPTDAVMVVPAYTFLMYNHPVDYQFWLEPGSRGWSERIYQPLTHPYVLSRSWIPDQVWNDSNEVKVNEEALCRLSNGLLHRCRSGVYLGISDLGEQGYEQRGELLKAFQRVLQDLTRV